MRRPRVWLLLAVTVVASCRPGQTGVRASRAMRPFGPEPARPAHIRNELLWHRTVADNARFAVYEEVVRRGEGANSFDDATAYFWDPAEARLTPISNHVYPSVRSEVALDGSMVIFAEQRDPGTRRDGVNPDPWVKRIARWDRATNVVVGLTDYRYVRIADLELSADTSTVAFNGDGDAFVVASAGGTPTDITHPSIQRGRNFGSTGNGAASLSQDGRFGAYTDLHGAGQIFLHDRSTGATRPLLDTVRDPATSLYQNDPSLCGDGSRLAFTGGNRIGTAGDRHQTVAAAFVAEPATGVVLASSRGGLFRTAETEYAEEVVLSPDCRRFAYVAPGARRGKDLHGNLLFHDDVVIVLEVGAKRPLGFVKTDRTPIAFLAQDPDTLVFDDGSTVRL